MLSSTVQISTAMADPLLPYRSDDKFGYIDIDMTIMIPATWDYVSYFRCDTAIVRIDSDMEEPQYGLIDRTGSYLVPLGNHRILLEEGGAYFGGEDGYYLIFDYSTHLFGYYDIRNHYYASPKYGSIDPFFRDESSYNMLFVGSAVISNQVRTIAYINSATEDILCEYDYYEHGNPYYGKVLCMDAEGAYWIQSGDGTRIKIDNQYELDSFTIEQGLFIVRTEQGYGLMNLSGSVVTEGNYLSIEYDPYERCFWGSDNTGNEVEVYATIVTAQ